MMDQSQVEVGLLRALEMLYARDVVLLQDDASEWSIAHRLAVYIEHQLPGWDVDCEFNRQGDGGGTKYQSDGSWVRPDIIVHQRRRVEREHNLLVVEVKKDSFAPELGKACDYTAPPNPARMFQYQFAVALVLSTEPKLTWFAEGREC